MVLRIVFQDLESFDNSTYGQKTTTTNEGAFINNGHLMVFKVPIRSVGILNICTLSILLKKIVIYLVG